MAEYVAQGDGWTSPFDDESDNAQFAQPLMCDDHPIIRAAYAEANAPQSSMMMSADFVASELSNGSPPCLEDASTPQQAYGRD